MRIDRRSASKPRIFSALSTTIKRLLLQVIRGQGAGTYFSRSAVDGFRSGKTTCEQAAAELGTPFGISTDVEGNRLATWCYAGHSGAKAVTIAFSNEGIMKRVVNFCEIHPSWDKSGPKCISSGR